MKLGRKVRYASGLERDYLQKLETLNDVIYYLEQPVKLDYEYDGRKRFYYPDVFFLLKDGRGIVGEIKPVFQMALQNNLAKWSALRQFCTARGYGLVVTDGQTSVQAVQRTSVRAEVAQHVLNQLAEKPLTWWTYNPIREQYNITRDEFVALVLRNRLQWRLSPFSLSLP